MRAIGTAAAALVVAGCYQMNATSVRVRTPHTDLGCVETADRVFEREGFAAPANVAGPGRFYTPRAFARSWHAFRWGIGVTIADAARGGDSAGRCEFELQALSADETCGLNCPLTPQPGQQYDDAVRKMAALLDEAFAGPVGRRAPP